MDSPARRKSTRSRPAKPPLSERAVIDAGLRVLRREGLDAVTMRKVAAELDTGPASLYVYVAQRDELLRLMLDAVIATVPLPELPAAPPGDWRARLAGLITDVVHALNTHPGIGRVSLGSIPASPAWLDLFDRILGLLLAGGVDRQRAAWGCDLIALHIGAVTYEVSVAHPPAGDGPDALQGALEARHAQVSIEDRLARLDPGRHPHLAASAAELAAGPAAARLALGIEVLIGGLAPA
ncbi:TetR/AcrR family transcriptional regulator [Streptomyces sp. NPDC048550]|uniref:TetR/AcrR family transcriptional regulator n=1 Tax=unclassified Streptomyces TaxID=2593676 RepID=UPI002E0E20B9|nr:TetR/AcrR family transcriptional regulator [Streptomyces sp. NBC_01296]WSW62630.1 TetR/AcrR family transcriptional regulator [Streptomyces sp. NBC_00998]